MVHASSAKGPKGQDGTAPNTARDITDRQVLMLVHRFSVVSGEGKNMTDAARVHNMTLDNGDIKQFGRPLGRDVVVADSSPSRRRFVESVRAPV